MWLLADGHYDDIKSEDPEDTVSYGYGFTCYALCDFAALEIVPGLVPAPGRNAKSCCTSRLKTPGRRLKILVPQSAKFRLPGVWETVAMRLSRHIDTHACRWSM